MSIDVSQFIQAFLDESFEGLDLMESELLGEEVLDAERINAIFRAAHSIKGSAGTFGFVAVAEFTHGVETLLDQIRDGERRLSEDMRALLLEAVDRIREMLVAARDGGSHDPQRTEETRQKITSVLGDANTHADRAPAQSQPAAAESPGAPAAPPSNRGWCIRFAPHPGLLATANDPLRIFDYLRQLGELTVTCHVDGLPGMAELDSEACHLSWTLELRGDVAEPAVREAFEWVEDQCELSVLPLAAASPPCEAKEPTSVAPEPSSAAAEPPPAVVEPAPVTIEPAPMERRAQTDRRGQTDRRAESSSIRVPVSKVDNLVDLVGELIISHAMLTTISDELEALGGPQVQRLQEGLAQLERNTRELQEAVLSVRMLPINFVFSRFPRMVRDLSGALGKKVQLVIHGEDTELDKGVIEKLVDPLTHIVRNAIDHGIERPDVREHAGKPASGTLKLSARHQGGNIVIEIADDGAGLDRDRILRRAAERGLPVPEGASDGEVWELIFAPGFSTAETVTDLSGRGVGMDVVRQNVESINGRLDIESESGAGSRITIRLPLTLAILDGMSVRVGEEIFILPLTAILESLQPAPDQLHSVSGRGRVVRLRGDYLPLVSLSEVFNVPGRYTRAEDGIVVVVESAKDRAALFVDELVAQHQVVIKSLETNYRKVPGVSGATIMGDGRVALILDVDMLTQVH